MLGFHFDPRNNGRLVELEFFRSSYRDQQASFDEFQRHLEVTYGPATRSGPGDEGFPWYEWDVAGTSIRHFVFDRFGPEEHLRIDEPEIPARLGLPLPSKTTPVSRLLTRNRVRRG
ncbi:MAG: hypothetical protein H0V36_09070 [Chloroflexi bacterium]|nr:hypothetical protein [Chloroflexota bacterium]